MNADRTYYEASGAPAPPRAGLQGEVSADVCVVGAGYAGLTAALHLAERGLSVVVLEAGAVGSGASGRNGGQIHTGQRVEQEALEAKLGPDEARRLWDLAEEGKALLRGLIAKHKIDCDLRDGMVIAAWKPGDAEPLRASVEHMASTYGYQTRWVEAADMPGVVQSTRYHGGVIDPGGGHLHALNYARGLARAAESLGAVIYEATKAVSVASTSSGVAVTTSAGRVNAAHAVLACDTWLEDLDKSAGARALPINSFVLTTAPLGEERATALIPSGAAVADTKFVVDYYRVTADHRLLFGGGENYTPRYPADLKGFIRKPMLRVFPQLDDVEIEFAWGGAVGITLSRMPHFGWSSPNVAFAHGFSGQGVMMATMAGKLLAEAVTGTLERFDTMARLKHLPFPGGRVLRTPMMALGMAWYALKDRL